MNTTIELYYQAQMRELLPRERMERCAAMFQWTRELVSRQVLAELGDMPLEQLKWELAKRIYAGDSDLLRLIEAHLKDVSS